MKLVKTLGISLGVILVLVIIAIVAAVMAIDSIAKEGVQRGATYALGVPTTLDSAHVGLTSGEFAMSGLTVANPAGFKDPTFLKLGNGAVAVSLGSLRKDVVDVPSLTLTGIRVDIERNAKGTNYQTILDGLKKFESGSPAPKGEEKKFIVREITIRDVSVKADMVGLPGGASTVTIPVHEVTLHNVGTAEGGATTGEIAAAIVKAVLSSAAAEGHGILPADLIGDLTGGLGNLSSLSKFDVQSIGKVGEAAKSLTAGVQQVGDQLKKGVDDAASQIKKGLGGLIPGTKK